ncbi:MAG: GNAT family N-acetyltransferase [Pseudomonadota bacterium]
MTGPLIIRPASCDDAEALSAVGRATFTETFGHLYKPEDLSSFLETSHSPAAYRRGLAKGGAAWLVYDTDDCVVGYAAVGPCQLPVDPMPPRAGELSRLYLMQAAQRGGQGTKLLAIALDWLEQRFDHVYLSVYSENLGAQRLYARHGFTKVAEYKYMVGQHADDEFIYYRATQKNGDRNDPRLSSR